MITKKRDSLESFIKEQIIGPGGCNYQYYIKREDNSERLEPGYSYGEVLNTTPGTIYSSAILFPQKAVEDIRTIIDNTQVDEENSNEEVDDIQNVLEEELSEERNVDHSEDIDCYRFAISYRLLYKALYRAWPAFQPILRKRR
jgi:hypothetical protein